MATKTHLQRLFAKPTKAARTALLLGTAALLLLFLAPQTMARGGSHHGGSRIHLGIGFHHFYPGYVGFGYGHGYGYYGHYGHYGSYGYYPYGYYGYGYGRGYGRGYGAQKFGALDLNVKPKDTQVWVNGGYVGTTGKLDGSPSMLWLEKDSYEVIFFKEGFETEVRRYTVTPGGIINERFEMRPGEARRPEDLSTAAPMPSPSADDGSKKHLERGISERRFSERRRERPAPRQERERTLDVRKEPGQLTVHATPKDASVYLDGDFIGTATDLRRSPVLLVDPGEHRVEIVHPGYESKKVEITVEAGKAEEIEVNLAKKQRADV